MNQTTALHLMKSGFNIFLTGQAGSGKTYVLNQYIQRCRDCEVEIAITASTGIAATHIGGTTIHSWSGIGIKDALSERDIDDIAGKSWIHKNISKASVLIIDEISMLSAQTLDNVERIVQAVKYDERPRGGMQVIFCGDFFQLPPISKYGDTQKRFAFAAQAWNGADLRFCYLDTQHRQTDDTEFSTVLDALRVGEVTDEIVDLLETRKDAVLAIEPPVRLYTHNVDVDRVNQEQLDSLPGKASTYTAGTKGNKKIAEGLLRGMLTPEVLELKIDAHVLFVKNNPALGYRNGTTGIVTGFHSSSGYPIVRTSDGETITVEPETWSVENNEEILASVQQIPLKLARAITVHKSQGMTLDAAEIDLSKSFAYGQSYVALSRVKSLHGLRLLGINKEGLQAHPLVLRGDRYFQEQSSLLGEQYKDISEEEWEELHEKFVTLVGGVYYSSGELAQQTRQPKELQKKKKKIDTVLATAELVKQEKSMEEMSEIRGLTIGTLIGHLRKIRIRYSEVDVHYLRPDDLPIERVQEVVDVLVEDEENFTERGELRLANVYRDLGGEIGYDDLKWCMVFVDLGRESKL